MPKEELVAYITAALEKGKQLNEIANNLLVAGWKEEDIGLAIDYVLPPEPDVPVPIPPQTSFEIVSKNTQTEFSPQAAIDSDSSVLTVFGFRKDITPVILMYTGLLMFLSPVFLLFLFQDFVAALLILGGPISLILLTLPSFFLVISGLMLFFNGLSNRISTSEIRSQNSYRL